MDKALVAGPAGLLQSDGYWKISLEQAEFTGVVRTQLSLLPIGWQLAVNCSSSRMRISEMLSDYFIVNL